MVGLDKDAVWKRWQTRWHEIWACFWMPPWPHWAICIQNQLFNCCLHTP